ncbi:MAG: hypothetical protein K0S56_3412 [Microvirga sp.]|jgi:transcriptional regulator with XRE-family HTH domain|nr:hypothetical protein [Microvirga sp.]
MVNGQQIRAARALLCWDQRELAGRAGISINSLSAFEDQSRRPIQRVRDAVVDALQAAGIRFVVSDEEIGVFLKRQSPED